MRLGIDIGGTDIKFLVLNDDKVSCKWQIPTITESIEAFVNSIISQYHKICREYPIDSVGIGFPGSIRSGIVFAENLFREEFPFLKMLEAEIDVPIKIDNDANCAALAETRYGNTRGYNNIILVTLGTGIGGGIVIDNKILAGRGYAGEIGHMVIGGLNGRPCNCGLNGCWEQYASATALIRDAKLAAEKNPDSLLSVLVKEKGAAFNGKDFFEALNQGCEVAKNVLSDYLDWLSSGIFSLIRIFEPEAVILAGGITKQGETFIDELRKRVYSPLYPDVQIEISTLQSEAGALGAALL